MPSTPVIGVGISIAVKQATLVDLPTALDEAQGLGVAFVELPLQDMDVVAGRRVLRDRLARAKRAIGARPLRYTLHGHLGINPMAEAHVAGLHEDLARVNIDIAAELGCIHLILHSGFCADGSGLKIEEAYDRQRSFLQRVAAHAADAGVIVCLENLFAMDERHTATPAKLAAELALVDHPHLRATFDFSHGALRCTETGTNFLAHAQALAPHAKHLHVHDSFGLPKDFWTYTQTEDMAFGIGDLHLPFGWGDIPWADIARECQFPADVIANIELDPRWWAEGATTVADVTRWVKTLRAA